jgi:hypothetical protein
MASEALEACFAVTRLTSAVAQYRALQHLEGVGIVLVTPVTALNSFSRLMVPAPVPATPKTLSARAPAWQPPPVGIKTLRPSSSFLALRSKNTNDPSHDYQNIFVF